MKECVATVRTHLCKADRRAQGRGSQTREAVGSRRVPAVPSSGSRCCPSWLDQQQALCACTGDSNRLVVPWSGVTPHSRFHSATPLAISALTLGSLYIDQIDFVYFESIYLGLSQLDCVYIVIKLNKSNPCGDYYFLKANWLTLGFVGIIDYSMWPKDLTTFLDA